MDQEQKNNPLHGITLEMILNELVEHFGWEELANKVNINCFKSNPSIRSSLTFLRKTPWAREKVEKLFRHNSRIVRAYVELVHGRSRDHSREFAAQIRLELPGPDIVVREESNDLYKSLDFLVDKVDRQLRRRHRLDKEKRNHPHSTDLGDLGKVA